MMILNDFLKDHEKYRLGYVLLFCSILVFAIIVTVIVYYLIRLRKKNHFDASGNISFLIRKKDYP